MNLLSALPRRSRTLSVACAVAASAALALSGCAKSETADDAGGDNGQGAQTVQTPTASAAAGEGCTLTAYGAPKLDLKNAIVGFSQSEKEANPFRIAETRSIKDEAAKVGVKKLLTTNAQSQLSKQISDIQDMLAQGAQFLIVAPLNSDGLEPAFRAAAAKKVPVLTIDRKVNATACKDYLASSARTSSSRASGPPTRWSRRPVARARSRSCSAPPATASPPTAPRASSTR